MAEPTLHPNGEPVRCWHSDPHGDGHIWERPGCPEMAVRSSAYLVQAAEVAEITGDAPGVMAILLASGAAAQQSARRARYGR